MAQLVQAHPDLSSSWFVTCMLLQILSRNTRLFKKILWLLRMHKPACSRSTAVVCNLHARLQSRSLIESLVWRSHEIHVSSEIRSRMEILTDPWLTQVLFENSCCESYYLLKQISVLSSMRIWTRLRKHRFTSTPESRSAVLRRQHDMWISLIVNTWRW